MFSFKLTATAVYKDENFGKILKTVLCIIYTYDCVVQEVMLPQASLEAN